MDNLPFVESFRSINSSYLKLIDSLSALRALSTIETEFETDQALLARALAVLMDNQDLERCSIYLLQDGQLNNVAGMDWQRLISLGKMANELPVRSGASFALGEGVVGLAAQSGQLLHCRDCEHDQRFMPRDALASTIVGSIISVPITHGSTVLGVLNVSHPHANFFDEGHERSLRIFSNVLGQLLVNNRLIHHMDELVKERTRQLEQALADAQELRRRFENLSAIDDLTQLHNRRFFFPESKAALARCMRHQQGFAMLLLDVDHFKAINDRLGHAIGDEVLRHVAQQLRELIREGDILARFGGEEFILALPNTNLSGAMVLAERIRLRIESNVWQSDQGPVVVTVSIGLSDTTGYEEKASQAVLDRLISEADQALYFGKHHGRNQSCSYTEIACKL